MVDKSPIHNRSSEQIALCDADSQSTLERSTSSSLKIIEVRENYQLPPRSTRGVPPKRYDPKFKLKGQNIQYRELAKKICPKQPYPLLHPYVLSIFSKTANEALNDDGWRQAMED